MTSIIDSRVAIQARITGWQRQRHYHSSEFLFGTAKRQKMGKRSQIGSMAFPEFGLLTVWLLFYGLLVVHGLTSSYVQRLTKAWTVEDEAGGSPGAAQVVRASLSLSADRIAH